MKKKPKIVAWNKAWVKPPPPTFDFSAESFKAPWLDSVLDSFSARHEINVAEFDAKTSQGYKLNFLTGEYYR